MNQLADKHGFLVLYPEQSTSANIGRCWNWHRTNDLWGGEPAAIANLTRDILARCAADAERVYIAGLSAGGAAAAVVAAAYPALYAAAGVHSGIARGNVDTLTGALAAARKGTTDSAYAGTKVSRPIPTIVFHGDQDRVVHPSNANGFLTVLRHSSGRPITGHSVRGRSLGGREFTRTLYSPANGEVLLEDWTVHGSGHAWAGGSAAGTYTDPLGPNASSEMVRFFLARKRQKSLKRKTNASSLQ